MPADEIHEVDGEEIQLYYIPDERNRYKPEENVIILDERLQEWPIAHEVIKQHELDHAKDENNTAFGLLVYELKTDLRRYFSSAQEWEAVRDYLQSHNRPTDIRDWLKHSSVQHLRGVWTAGLLPLHGCYRALVGTKKLFRRS